MGARLAEASRLRWPAGAGLPHLPTLLSASKSYSERLFSYQRIDRLDRAAADLALQVPANDEDAEFTPDALAAMYRVPLPVLERCILETCGKEVPENE